MISQYLTFYSTHLPNKKFRYSKWPKIYHIILFIFIAFFITKNQLFIFSRKSLIDKRLHDQSLYNILMVFPLLSGIQLFNHKPGSYSQIELGKTHYFKLQIYISTVIIIIIFPLLCRGQMRERRGRNVQLEDFMKINILFQPTATQPTSLIFLPSNV